jgi:hypothetical protein
MTTTGPNTPGTMTAGSTSGGIWANPNNAKVSDNSYTQVTNSNQFFGTDKLVFSNFGFAIDSGDTIDGVQFDVERSYVTAGQKDANVQLTLDASSGSGTNQASASSWPTTDTVATYGGPTDTWGLSLTPADVNASNFGVFFKAIGTTFSIGTARIDYGTLTIYSTPSGGGGPATATRRLGLLGVG